MIAKTWYITCIYRWRINGRNLQYWQMLTPMQWRMFKDAKDLRLFKPFTDRGSEQW